MVDGEATRRPSLGRRAPGWVLHLMAGGALAMLVLGEADLWARTDSWLFALFVLLSGVVLAWLGRLLLYCAHRLGKGPVGPWPGFLVLPMLALVGVPLGLSGVPRAEAWTASRPAFERARRHAPAAPGRGVETFEPGWIGPYHADSGIVVRDAVIFVIPSMRYGDANGIACLPSDPVIYEDLTNFNFLHPVSHLGGCWYRWKAGADHA